MKERSQTKIICTLGPASEDLATIEQLFLNGMSIARLNMSHGSFEDHLRIIENVRQVEEKHGVKIFIALDTKGPELRVTCEHDLEIKEGDTVKLVNPQASDTDKAHHTIKVDVETFQGVAPESSINLDDAKLFLKVKHVSANSIEAVALNNHVLKDHKRIHFESLDLNLPFVSAEDRDDIKFAIENSIDAVFVSFVQTSKDMLDMRSLVPDSTVQMIAKIESGAAVKNLADIARVSDGLMVARGDLMNDVGTSALFSSQKLIVEWAGKLPVIMATEMLQSMVEAMTPRRSEISDVGNAILDGCSGIMLSSETSIGKYPSECVDTMRTIALDAEKYTTAPVSGSSVFLKWESTKNRADLLKRGVYFNK